VLSEPCVTQDDGRPRLTAPEGCAIVARHWPQINGLGLRLDKGNRTRYCHRRYGGGGVKGSRVAVARKTPWLLLFFVVVGGLFGGLVAEVLRAVSPTGPISSLFLGNLNLGITEPMTIDLYLMTVTFGAAVKVNLLSVIGVLMGWYIYSQA